MRFLKPLGFLSILFGFGLLHGLNFSDSLLPSQVLAVGQLITWGFSMGLILHYSHTRKQAFGYGMVWGVGHFLSSIYWIWISIHVFGGMPVITAGIALLTLVLYLALFPALSCVFIIHWLKPSYIRLMQTSSQVNIRSMLAPSFMITLGMATIWTVFELLRANVLTGFPWTMTGYAWVDSPLAGWAPLFGVYSITFWSGYIAAWCILLIVLWGTHLKEKIPVIQRWSTVALIAMSLPILIGNFSRAISWTSPVGEPLQVLLVQPNTPIQDRMQPEKWTQIQSDQQELVTNFLQQHPKPIDIAIFPESNLPTVQIYLTQQEWQSWLKLSHQNQLNVLLGTIYVDTQAPKARAYNSALWIQPTMYQNHNFLTTERVVRYNKDHLVPFGEFIPSGFKWFVDLLKIPLDNLTKGGNPQHPWNISETQLLAINICFEDVFGTNLISTLQQSHAQNPTLGNIHVNISNLTWFGQSKAGSQHLWISRMRALETQTPVLRSANSSETAAIDAQGNIIARSEAHQAAVVPVSLQGTNGLTPFSRWGNTPMLILLCVGILSLWFVSRKLSKIQL